VGARYQNVYYLLSSLMKYFGNR